MATKSDTPDVATINAEIAQLQHEAAIVQGAEPIFEPDQLINSKQLSIYPVPVLKALIKGSMTMNAAEGVVKAYLGLGDN
jgi:fructose-bisphosphate aldolase class 1